MTENDHSFDGDPYLAQLFKMLLKHNSPMSDHVTYF